MAVCRPNGVRVDYWLLDGERRSEILYPDEASGSYWGAFKCQNGVTIDIKVPCEPDTDWAHVLLDGAVILPQFLPRRRVEIIYLDHTFRSVEHDAVLSDAYGKLPYPVQVYGGVAQAKVPRVLIRMRKDVQLCAYRVEEGTLLPRLLWLESARVNGTHTIVTWKYGTIPSP